MYSFALPEGCAMRRHLIVLLWLCSSLLSGCATERKYFFNHNPFTDTALFLGGIFAPCDPMEPTDVHYRSDERAGIRPL